MNGHVTSATAQGGRESQEDRFVAVPLDPERGRWLLGVFDGHIGPAAAELAARLGPDAFTHALDRHGEGKAAIEATIGVLREEAATLHDGSSVSLAYVDGEADRVVVGVLGDSPVIVRDADGELVLGPLHNTSANPADAARAVERGAIQVGPYLCDPKTLDGVNLTRTIGDADLPFLGRAPEVLTASLGPGSFVVVATDGLFSFNASTPRELVERVAGLVDTGADADDLVADALTGHSDDNVTVVLWRAGG